MAVGEDGYMQIRDSERPKNMKRCNSKAVQVLTEGRCLLDEWKMREVLSLSLPNRQEP
jgi:hypothetical protein